jgi:hypothetical protein
MSQNAQENRHSSSCDAHSRVKDVADDNSCCLTDCDWSDVFDVQLPDTLSVGDQIKNHLYDADCKCHSNVNSTVLIIPCIV